VVKQQIIEEISQQLKYLVENTPIADIQKNIKALLVAGLAKLDLVTREEFDVQQQVLATTRAKLEHLEQLINQLTNTKASQ
jgi:ubiquinone biosynthesis accessory factor UbiK